jgi:hypothetical protein
VATERPTSLGDNIEGGFPGYGRTYDEAVEDAFHNAGASKDPGWWVIAATFVFVENPIREYKVIITPGG